MRKAKFGLSLTAGKPAKLLVFPSKVMGALTEVAVGKSTKLVPSVEYCRRTYLLPVLLARWSQRMLMFCLPAVLTLNRAPAVLLLVPCGGNVEMFQAELSVPELAGSFALPLAK